MSYAVSNTWETALEQAIERYLAGFTMEEQGQGVAEVGTYGMSAYRIGHAADFDAALALDTAKFWAFLEATQGKALNKLKERSPADWQVKVLGSSISWPSARASSTS